MGGAIAFGVVTSAIGLAIGIWFYTVIGWPLLPFILLGAIFVVAYTDVLTKIGIGEVAAGLGLGGLPVAGVALVQAGIIGPAAIAAAIPATFMTFNLLLLNEFPDEDADRKGGRRHLVIQLGRPGAARVYAAAALLTPISIVVSVLLDAFPLVAVAAVLPSIMLAKPLQWAFKAPNDEVPVPALGANVVWIHLTNLILAAALIVDIHV